MRGSSSSSKRPHHCPPRHHPYSRPSNSNKSQCPIRQGPHLPSPPTPLAPPRTSNVWPCNHSPLVPTEWLP